MSDERKDDDEKGKAGEAGGGPALRPDLESLLEGKGREDGEGGSKGGGESAKEPSESFGDWDFYADSLLLWNRRRKRKLLLEQLDSASKITKMSVALGIQGGWDTDSMMKALDSASQSKFKKSFYHLVSSLHEAARIDWAGGEIVDPRKGHFKP